MEECNVVTLETCSDLQQYCTVRAQPDFQALGKKVGKDMPKVAQVRGRGGEGHAQGGAGKPSALGDAE